jgi:hypothetical protein
MVFG